jgi:hypothetical protein
MSPAMDSPPPSPEAPPAAVPPKRRRALWRFLAVSVSLFAILVILFLAFVSSNPQFVWLTPAQIAQAGRPGLLTRLKYQLIRLAGPLMRYYHSHGPNIMITSSIIRMSPGTGPPALGAPVASDASGMSAWILSPAQLASLRQSLRTNPAAFLLLSPSILTSSGVQSRASVGQSVPLAPGIYTNVGITLDATAKASSGSINLLLNASSTALSALPGSNGPSIKTNFSTACRVMLPDAGGLVISCKNADPANPTNYWVVVSPTLVDATGQPIKH